MDETRVIPRKQAGTTGLRVTTLPRVQACSREDRAVWKALQVERTWIDGTLWGGQGTQARETA